MDCFIKRIFEGKIDEQCHQQFVRFGRGKYSNRAVISLQKTPSKLKLKSSFEFANDIANIAAELANSKFNGVILSKNNIVELKNYEFKRKSGILAYQINDISSNTIKQISNKIYYLLLNTDNNIKLKTKKKLPKPGKDEDKIDDKFVQAEFPLQYQQQVMQAFFWDVPECKKAKISHDYIIKDIIIPSDVNKDDFEKIRLTAKRKCKIIRNINVDGEELKKEAEAEV